ncbi:uncharacterized protein SOCE836_102430 [Sorangium cellulosum]|uniref:Uncharacterized protein n=1 Tax=Sorangium cellulosum TaxID=56 RepID=A0A4P2R4N8_SORCE|nr:uncharacterized protein SOCE836_102430 [Sorangium cellulosum]WCQ97293.1 hypothetical protein NQZ70_10084 [Sorangium sp. Soce836]
MLLKSPRRRGRWSSAAARDAAPRRATSRHVAPRPQPEDPATRRRARDAASRARDRSSRVTAVATASGNGDRAPDGARRSFCIASERDVMQCCLAAIRVTSKVNYFAASISGRGHGRSIQRMPQALSSMTRAPWSARRGDVPGPRVMHSEMKPDVSAAFIAAQSLPRSHADHPVVTGQESQCISTGWPLQCRPGAAGLADAASMGMNARRARRNVFLFTLPGCHRRPPRLQTRYARRFEHATERAPEHVTERVTERVTDADERANVVVRNSPTKITVAHLSAWYIPRCH